MVSDIPPADLSRNVPACPGWTVRDVIAHLAGGCADMLAGDIEGVTTAQWADSQVRRRQGHTVAQVLEEWAVVAPRLEAIVETFPAPLPTVWILDLTAHEHDVRGALVRPGARETPGLVMAVDFLVREGLHRRLVGRDLGPLAIRTPVAAWIVGGKAPSAEIWDPAGRVDDSEGPGREVAPASGASAATAVELSLFEAFRALTGRRSYAQIARYGWTSEPEPFLAAFQFGTFTTRTSDLYE